MRRHLLLFSLCIPLLIAACERPQQGLDAEDERNPYFRSAAKYVSEDNFYAAIGQYEKALAENPQVAKAHVQIGQLYGEKLGDPVSAIYHYQKYLSIRPDAADREQIQALIEKAKIDFALTLPNSTAHNSEEVARINKENVELKQALAQAQGQNAVKSDESAAKAQALTSPPPAKPAKPAAATPQNDNGAFPSVVSVPPSSNANAAKPATTTATDTTGAAAGSKTHVIQKGDNLWKIAKQYYPDDIPAGIAKIKQANPQATSDVKNLKLGTTLVIP
ncbi:MAG: LysM peptidoglycan-binding domain-containing protein [Methylacidiphilales bacterium]|nr:LysM peptidoglycan-binding domain-containing protein [Candidatus Methylacidiphilales bacterium]